MRQVCLIAVLASLGCTPALAQSPAPHHTGPAQAQPSRRAPDAPLDYGPYTPEASRAYQGGGMVLQGAPGAPPPMPEPTPPGQTPRNMVPPR
jgi:hypothetical protein